MSWLSCREVETGLRALDGWMVCGQRNTGLRWAVGTLLQRSSRAGWGHKRRHRERKREKEGVGGGGSGRGRETVAGMARRESSTPRARCGQRWQAQMHARSQDKHTQGWRVVPSRVVHEVCKQHTGIHRVGITDTRQKHKLRNKTIQHSCS